MSCRLQASQGSHRSFADPRQPVRSATEAIGKTRQTTMTMTMLEAPPGARTLLATWMRTPSKPSGPFKNASTTMSAVSLNESRQARTSMNQTSLRRHWMAHQRSRPEAQRNRTAVATTLSKILTSANNLCRMMAGGADCTMGRASHS